MPKGRRLSGSRRARAPLRAVVYLQYARCAFQRRAAYRLANWTGIAVNFFFFLLHAQVYLAFFRDRTMPSGWRAEDAVLYFATSEALMMTLAVFPDRLEPLSERIRTGQVTTDLARPVDLYLRDLGERYGNALYFLLTRTTVLYAGALLVFPIAPSWQPALAWLPLSLLLAVAVSGTLWYLANAMAFWTEHAHGPIFVMVHFFAIFGGALIPLDFYPDWLRWLSDALPFRAALYTPVALATGKLAGASLAFGLVHQVVWLALLVAAARGVEARGVRRLVLHGG